MTDTLLKPEDTGEILRRDPGQTTTNLMFVLNPPALRRPDATKLPIIEGGCRTVVPEDAPDEFTTAPAEPPPPPPPAPRVDDRPLSAGEEIVWDVDPDERAYVGVHRRPSRWDWMTVPLSMAVQRIGRAL